MQLLLLLMVLLKAVWQVMQPGEAGQAVFLRLQQGIHHSILCQSLLSTQCISVCVSAFVGAYACACACVCAHVHGHMPMPVPVPEHVHMRVLLHMRASMHACVQSHVFLWVLVHLLRWVAQMQNNEP